MGTESRKVHRSAVGWASCTPVSPATGGSSRMTGRKKSPCRARARTEALPDSPTVWSIMLLRMISDDRGRVKHWKRRAWAPMAMTVGSSRRNTAMIWGAKRNPSTATAARKTAESLRQK